MSLVGTRPILQDELLKYELHHRARIAIKPGITGMWQVSGRSDITDFEEVVRLDTEYISTGDFRLGDIAHNVADITKAEMLTRSIYSTEVEKAIKKEIKDIKPDLVYIIHFVNKLSPSVICGAKKMGIPVVLRLSDYFLLCPRFDFMYNKKPCGHSERRLETA